MSWDSGGDGKKLSGIHGGMKFYFTFMVHLQEENLAFKLLKKVCSDFTPKDCIKLSVK